MGNNSSKKGNGKQKTDNKHSKDQNQSSDMSRSPSGTDIQNNVHSQFQPLDKLAKILTDLAQKEESIHGVTPTVFRKYLFPNYPELADKLFIHLHCMAKTTTPYLSCSVFKHQTEKFLGIMNDQTILENYVKMFSDTKDQVDITQSGLTDLLLVSYRLARNSSGSPSCPYLLRSINAVITACFHGKDSLSISFVSNWLSQNCPRIAQGLHRYVVHILTTAYRSGKSLMSNEETRPHMEPSTPVLDQPDTPDFSESTLASSLVWLLSITLPDCYIQNEESKTEGMQALIMKMSGNTCPRHWTLLYHSDQHGAGANRFLHHVLSYKGPTLIFITGVTENQEQSPAYCICSPNEWKESHLYWGNQDSVVIEILPFYKVVEKGPKLLYLNTSIRGYPQGLRAGSDPKNPCVIIDQSFNSVNFAGVPYKISTIEVWGCGDTKSREVQLEIKKWQVKEAEKQRTVKLSTSEWLDHPDRYLLEMAGRQSYNNSSS